MISSLDSFCFSSSRGNAALETVLCMPVALLILFGAVDAGLSFIEAASARDALRTGILSVAETVKQSPIVKLGENGEFEPIDSGELTELAEQLADRVTEKLQSVKASSVGSERQNFRVEVVPIIAAINSMTGQLESDSTQILASVVSKTSAVESGNNASANGRINNSVSRTRIGIDELLQQEAQILPARGAVVVGQGLNSTGANLDYQESSAGAAGGNYFYQAAYFLVVAEAVSGGTNQSYLEQALGSKYSYVEQELIPARNLVH